MKLLLSLPFFYRLGLALVISGLLSFAGTPAVKRMAYRVGAVDVPKDARRMHHVPIPRLGGLAIALGFLFSVLLLVPIDNQTQGILLGAILIVVLGVLDDSLTLKAIPKLLVQILAAVVVVRHGVAVRYITDPFSTSPGACIDLGVLSAPLTVLWIVAITNAVNFIDGLDGLAVGVSAISSLTMLVIALLVAEENVPIVLAALLGGCLGFIPYNTNPAKIFMGDTGSTFLGFMLATMSIQGMFKLYAVISFAVPFLILGIPIFDICFAVIRRTARGQSPFHADRGHIHHRLIDMGFTQKQTVAITYILTGILGLAAVLLTTSGEIKALLLLGAVLVVGALGILLIFRREDSDK